MLELPSNYRLSYPYPVSAYHVLLPTLPVNKRHIYSEFNERAETQINEVMWQVFLFHSVVSVRTAVSNTVVSPFIGYRNNRRTCLDLDFNSIAMMPKCNFMRLPVARKGRLLNLQLD